MKNSLKIHVVALSVSLLYTLAPFFTVFGSLGLAKIANCDGLNEGSPPDCAIESVENLVYTGFVSGWFALITLPTGGPIALILLVSLPIHYFIKKNQKSSPD